MYTAGVHGQPCLALVLAPAWKFVAKYLCGHLGG
jgi:hypothetical protein